MIPLVAHITLRHDWEAALLAGEYRAASLETQGFIHCSEPTERQLIAVADHIYRGVPGLLVLLIDTARLTWPLKFEEYEPGSDKFPHLYGPLNLDAVTQVLQFSPEPDGTFKLPAALAALT